MTDGDKVAERQKMVAADQRGERVYLLRVPEEVALRVPADMRFVLDLTDEGLLYRPVREPVVDTGLPKWLTDQEVPAKPLRAAPKPERPSGSDDIDPRIRRAHGLESEHRAESLAGLSDPHRKHKVQAHTRRAHEVAEHEARQATRAGGFTRASTTRHPIVEDVSDRTWTPDQMCHPHHIDWVFMYLEDYGPECQDTIARELAEYFEVKLETARCYVSASLLALLQTEIVEWPGDTKPTPGGRLSRVFQVREVVSK